ncbi:hypothetical protein, partial [Clostridium thermobutyricum]|uniref:hypothetical protein n=1 Tax=Clostridium thermobutyricum TaxID=29372 RepID=UPI001A9A8E9D
KLTYKRIAGLSLLIYYSVQFSKTIFLIAFGDLFSLISNLNIVNTFLNAQNILINYQILSSNHFV